MVSPVRKLPKGLGKLRLFKRKSCSVKTRCFNLFMKTWVGLSEKL